MLASTTNPLRLSARSCRFQPSLFAPCRYQAPSTRAVQRRPLSSKPSFSQVARATSKSLHIKPKQKRSISPIRAASTSATPASAYSTTASSSSAASSSPISTLPLTWNEFLRLRKVRHRFNIVASISTATLTTLVGVMILSQQDLEALSGQVLGLDPFVVLGLATVGCAAAGWLIGPVLGGTVFGFWYRRFGAQVAEKEREFFYRIKKYRVEPSSQSIANPVPDYYGERIGSLQGYRHWLKDQRAYNKKRQSYV
ncbi:MAG: presequence translocase-associated motor subunit [Lasallia pustulata]|uniref:Presequence translocated-associated motor subunit PAM17 n=1 Tax=Lasallia pustulata TaxID=136370 RepID=A0A5M8PEC5_9LECA|nr:MAG: presequence translocase-associated motor subunit [Lasallia pustulata]